MRLLTITAAFMATGCVSVLPEAGPAPQVYRLDGGAPPATAMRAAAFDAETVAPSPGLTVTVMNLMAPRALTTDRLAVMTSDGRLSYASDARWNARAPDLVQERLLTAFEDDRRIEAATRAEDGVPTRYELRIEMLRFEADYKNGDQAPPVATVGFRGKLIDRRTRDLVASTRFEAEAPASENRVGAIVTAFDAAMADASRAILDWAVEAHEARPAEELVDPPPPAAPSQSAASAASSSR
jgi:cholesterol transport system auxiliary component